ncbi:non-POU domain-containing octamer-binding protein-like [Galendromus occidentalis]|uniref:Non-POU domain-containing octamer-binding protein-like n=1 Tax=Galendromus occidentalis TaxID=34638 RepID=A0AAJ7SHJ6_9ACAR|nr:non-POU domain-containing octamer-binding protein-like [Galendromus occidentalis]
MFRGRGRGGQWSGGNRGRGGQNNKQRPQNNTQIISNVNNTNKPNPMKRASMPSPQKTQPQQQLQKTPQQQKPQTPQQQPQQQKLQQQKTPQQQQIQKTPQQQQNTPQQQQQRKTSLPNKDNNEKQQTPAGAPGELKTETLAPAKSSPQIGKQNSSQQQKFPPQQQMRPTAQQQQQQHQMSTPLKPMSQQQQSNAAEDDNLSKTKLFIATVKQGISDQEFRELFTKFGNVTDLFLHKQKWFGLVTFEKHEEAEAARKHYINSNILKLKWAQDSNKETPLILNQTPDQIPVKKDSSSKCRLFIGNLIPDITEDGMRNLLEPFGNLVELFVPPGKGFAFARYETRANAEAAKSALDGELFSNRQLQVRFASQGAVLKVRNLSPFVSNELLHQAFEPFGELERATVFVDERGKSLGEGILEFSRKPVALAVMRKAQLECLLLTTSPLPVIIEPMELKDDEDGYSERTINKQSTGYLKEREKGPRFAERGSFESEFAMKWKELLALEKLKKEQLDREIQLEKQRLMEEMDIMKYDYDVEALKRRLKALEARHDEFENRKMAAEKNNKAREDELRLLRKNIAKRQAEILGYTYEDEDANQPPPPQAVDQKCAPAPDAHGVPQQLLSGHPVADAVLGAALLPPPGPPGEQQPSAMAENFLKNWNSITKGVPVGQDDQNKNAQQPQQPQTSPQAAAAAAHKMQNTNMPAYMSYMGQATNGKRVSDMMPPGQKRRRF